MSYNLNDPGLDLVEREVPVNPEDRLQGSFKVTFQPIPVGKYRSLWADFSAKRDTLQKLDSLLKLTPPLEGAQDLAELERLTKTASDLARAREAADEALTVSLMQFVGWGIVGFSDIVRSDGSSYPESQPKPIKWAGHEYKFLDDAGLYLFWRLSLLSQLGLYIIQFQNRTLPKTLEEFYTPAP